MSPDNNRAHPILRGRFCVVLVCLALGFSALLARAIELQVLRTDFYQHQGEARYIRQVPIPTGRGMIVDRNGEPLAISTPVQSIWANPQELLQAPDRLLELAKLLGQDADTLALRLGQRAEREFVYLKRHASQELVARALALDMPGLNLQREYRRFYPAGEVTSHVLGFTDIDDRGQEGLELAFEEWLSGTPGSKRVIQDLYGHVVENVELVADAHPGRDLVTSIDRRLQYVAYRELKSAVLEHHAQSGSVVVLDVATGEVLAMVNQPSYNPNRRARSEHRNMRNRAVTDFFEPGSVIKPFAMAAALESGQFTLHSTVDTSPGYYQISGYTIRDFRDYGMLDLTGILSHSSNVGMSKLAAALDTGHLRDMYRRFGFGQVTGSGFPGESPGILADPERWREVEKVAASYGYGLSTTPLQLAQGFAAIANGGRVRAPSFVRHAHNPDNAVLDPALADTLIGMLETVTATDGTGHRAGVSYYRVAGKTGTSRKASADGYSNRYVGSFAGLAPASQPRIVVVVSIHDPATDEYYGGQVAAPIFARVMAAALRLLDIPPDNLIGQELAQAGGVP